MKTKQILILLVVLLTGCAEDVERLAHPYLERAELFYAAKQYGQAKLQLDSIKILYPKAFETRKRAQQLQIQVELDEATTNKQYIDSILTENLTRLPILTTKLYLDKDDRYQDIGHYYSPRHRAEKQMGRSYLRPQVSEQGVCSIVVFHRGKGINAHTLRFTAADGTFIELKAQAEPYIISDASGRTERTDYAVNTEDGIASFVAQHETLPRVVLIGPQGTVAVPFNKHDSEAMKQVCELSSLLRLTNELKQQADELNRRIEFFSKRVS